MQNASQNALLSAAELHGAAHQRPQLFQVMVKANRRPVECGKVGVQFVACKDMEGTSTVARNTPRGLLRVASPEATALELIGYADQSGGLDNVASVLSELVEAINPDHLIAECGRSPVAWLQRLGYLLDLTEHHDLADKLVPSVVARAKDVAPLVRARSRSGSPRNERWKLVINATMEPDP